MESYYLIGVSGEFYIIMNSEEAIGYIPQDWLWAGNGNQKRRTAMKTVRRYFTACF